MRFHELIIKRINGLYEHKCSIHVVTDKIRNNQDNIVYHYVPDLDRNHFAKLVIYGLLNEPAVFLDNDILLIRRFEEKHLPLTNPFNLYRRYDIKSRKLLPKEMKKHIHYNTGVVWIAAPSQHLVKEFTSIKKNFINYRNGWDDAWMNDEFVINKFIAVNKIVMKEMDDVNKYRSDVSQSSDLIKYQSVHYRQRKQSLITDYRYIIKHG